MTDSGFALDDNFVYGSLSTSKELYSETTFLRNYLCILHVTLQPLLTSQSLHVL